MRWLKITQTIQLLWEIQLFTTTHTSIDTRLQTGNTNQQYILLRRVLHGHTVYGNITSIKQAVFNDNRTITGFVTYRQQMKLFIGFWRVGPYFAQLELWRRVCNVSVGGLLYRACNISSTSVKQFHHIIMSTQNYFVLGTVVVFIGKASITINRHFVGVSRLDENKFWFIFYNNETSIHIPSNEQPCELNFCNRVNMKQNCPKYIVPI